MIKAEKATPNKVVRKKDDCSRTLANAGDRTNRIICVPRRNLTKCGDSVNSRSERADKSSNKEQNECRAEQISAVDVPLPKKNKELANLVVNIGSGSIITPICSRSERKLIVAFKVDDLFADDSSLSQQRKPASCFVKKEECPDDVSLMVHANKSAAAKPKNIFENNNILGKSTAITPTRARSTSRMSIKRSRLTDDFVADSTDVLRSTTAVEAPHRANSSRGKIVDSNQKEASTARLDKEKFNGDYGASIFLKKLLPTSTKPYSVLEKTNEKLGAPSVKKRAQSTPRSIQKPLLNDAVISGNSHTILSASAVQTSLKNNPRQRKSVTSQNELASAPLLKKEEFNDNKSLIVHLNGLSLASPKANSISEKKNEKATQFSTREQMASNGIQEPLSADNVVADSSTKISISSIDASNKDATRKHIMTEPSQKEVIATGNGISMNMFALDNGNSGSESDSSNNDRSSDEDYDPTVKRRKRRSVWESESEEIAINPTTCDSNNKKKKSGERPFSCSYCDQQFNDSGHCRKHERTHTDVTKKCTDQSSSREFNNLLDDSEDDEKIHFRSKPIEYIVEKTANKYPDKICLVWSRKFSMDLASAVARSGPNCILIVKKFNTASFPDVWNLSNWMHIYSIDVGPGAQPFRLFSFGGSALPGKIGNNGGFKSLTKFESKMKKFARSQGTKLVNIFKHADYKNDWYGSLRGGLKEECIVTNMF